MRFNNADEVRAAAQKAAAEDYEKHAIIHTDENGEKYQIDLNPYSTEGARNDWQRGYNNAPPFFPEVRKEFDFQYQRGRAAAEIVKRMEAGK